MLRPTTYFVLLSAILASGCASSKSVASLPFNSLPIQDQEVYLTIYHHMFAHWLGKSGGIPERFFLSCQEKDVQADLLSQFQQEGYQVALGSKYRHGRGIHCDVRKIQWLSPVEAKVWGGYMYGNLGGSAGYFILKKENDKWSVASWKPELFALRGTPQDETAILEQPAFRIVLSGRQQSVAFIRRDVSSDPFQEFDSLKDRSLHLIDNRHKVEIDLQP